MGHESKEHGDGIHLPSTLIFKNLRAPSSLAWSTKRRNNKKKAKGYEQPKGNVGAKRFDEHETQDVDMNKSDLSRKRGSEWC